MEVVDEFPENKKEETVKEYIERRKIEIEKEIEQNKIEEEEEKTKIKWKYIMFNESEEEKEKRKKYLNNLLEWYERVKWKQFIKKHFVENIPDNKEKFHWFLYWTQAIMKIENRISKDENKKLKKLLLSNRKND